MNHFASRNVQRVAAPDLDAHWNPSWTKRGPSTVLNYSPSAMQIGDVISGKYRLLRLLGDGGMGSVYEAQHQMLGTRVAIKMLHPELVRRTGLVDRFLQEAQVAAQIKSPYVVQVTDIDKTPEGTAYIVMELLEGEPMSSLLERDRKVPIAQACDYTIQILNALEAAHALGVVHRDLKPENVFITFAAGKPILKLIDFGIAKLKSSDPAAKNLTVAGVLMGTAEYMAPEQAFSADKADARSDIYAVGVMLYEMIAGIRPVLGDDARIIATKVERGEVTPLVHAAPDAPREIAGLVHRAMAARPDLRFASAAEMRLALEGVLSGKRAPTAALQEIARPSPDAGTGTVMGAPADAILAGLKLDPRLAQMPAGTGTLPAPLDAPPHPMTRAAGGHMPQQTPAVMHQSSQRFDSGRPARRRSRGPLVAVIVIALLVGSGVALAFFVDWGSYGTTLPPVSIPTATPTTTTSTLTLAPTSNPTSNDPLAPLNPGTTRPPTPQVPPRTNPSAPVPKPSASTPEVPTVPTVPTFPTTLPSTFPNPFPPGSTGLPPVFTIPTTFPSVFPGFPLPGPPAAPTPAPSSPGY